MNQISTAWNACSAEIKSWLIRQPDVKVESLTSWLLPNLALKSNAIKYKQLPYSAAGQSRVADWEWWFVFSNTSSFAARVLAKRLAPSVDNYTSIAAADNGKQEIDELLDASAKDGYASFYVLYSTNDHNSSICKNGKRKDGIFHVEANKLRSEFIMKDRKTLYPSDILAIANPVSCAFGCPGIYGEGMDKEAGFRQHIDHYFPLRADHLADRSDFGESGFRETPRHIMELLDNGTNTDDWEAKHQHVVKGSKAVVVVDMRDSAAG